MSNKQIIILIMSISKYSKRLLEDNYYGVKLSFLSNYFKK